MDNIKMNETSFDVITKSLTKLTVYFPSSSSSVFILLLSPGFHALNEYATEFLFAKILHDIFLNWKRALCYFNVSSMSLGPITDARYDTSIFSSSIRICVGIQKPTAKTEYKHSSRRWNCMLRKLNQWYSHLNTLFSSKTRDSHKFHTRDTHAHSYSPLSNATETLN